MAKAKDTPRQETERSLYLIDVFFELNEARKILGKCEQDEMSIRPFLRSLILLLRIAEEKVSYYSDKYNFKVPESETYYVENACDFFEAKEAYAIQQATGGEV